MFRTNISALFFVALLGFSFTALGASTGGIGGVKPVHNQNGSTNNNNNNSSDKNKDGSKVGSSDTVKKWKDDDVDDAKKSEQPMCIYIYDADDKNNTRAKQIESASALNSAEVRDKLKPFKCVKLKESDGKHWPADWVSQAKNGAVLVFASSDMKQIQMIDRNFPHENITIAALEGMIDNILKYEDAKKGAKQK